MTTFDDVVDRVYRDWLHGPDEQPIVATLDGAVDASTTTLVIDTTGLDAKELSALSAGTLLEVDYEQVLVRSVTSSTATVVRGRNGTTAATHADGATVTLLPRWGRQTVLDAVFDEVVRLYPDLHAVASVDVVSDASYAEAPAALETIQKAYVQEGSTYRTYDGLVLLRNFSPSSTDKALRFNGLASGKTVHISYRGRFTRPTAATDTLADSSVDEGWVPILSVGAAAAVVASEDVDRATVEFVTRQLEQEQFTVGSSSRIRDSLLRYRQFLLEQARRAQRAGDTTPILQQAAVWP